MTCSTCGSRHPACPECAPDDRDEYEPAVTKVRLKTPGEPCPWPSCTWPGCPTHNPTEEQVA